MKIKDEFVIKSVFVRGTFWIKKTFFDNGRCAWHAD